MLGVTACLAIENTVKDGVHRGLQVFIVSAAGKVKQRLERFDLSQILPPNHLLANRTEALQQALFFVIKYSGYTSSNILALDDSTIL
ncbi:sulfate permease family protein [Richelia intracellularis HH01]|uniref:Sulfate permease family protein n=1 Tax=Richelia intracellularis HH01 TaxID=1165094 RepID=M1X4Q5_9NOST|nr:sulfate permease family protein [Richelia intracellularis HH01]